MFVAVSGDGESVKWAETSGVHGETGAGEDR